VIAWIRVPEVTLAIAAPAGEAALRYSLKAAGDLLAGQSNDLQFVNDEHAASNWPLARKKNDVGNQHFFSFRIREESGSLFREVFD